MNQAKANVAKDEAQAKNNNVQAQRYRNLYRQKAVSQSQVEQFEMIAATQQATVTADRDAVANAVAAVGAAKAADTRAVRQLSVETDRGTQCDRGAFCGGTDGAG